MEINLDHIDADTQTHIKDYITSIIGHLLDFANEPIELAQQITQLNEACSQEVKEGHNNYHQLRAVLLNPQHTLFGLENYQSYKKPTVAEVKKFILVVISEHLQKVNYHWDIRKQQQQLITPTDITTIFASKNIPTATDPWLTLTDSNDNFLAKIYEGEADDSVILEIEFKAIVQQPLFFKLCENTPVLQHRQAFLYSLIPAAKQQATYIVAQQHLAYLLANAKISQRNHTYIKNHFNVFAELLCNPGWFELFANKHIAIKSIPLNCTAQLRQPLITHLLANDLCTLSQATKFNTAQLRFIAAYNTFVNTKSLTIAQILNLTKSQCDFLIHPTIINLIKKNLLSFATAFTFPIHLKSIFNNNFYAEYIFHLAEKYDMPWDTLLALEPIHCQYLLLRSTMNLLTAKVLNLQTIATFNATTINILHTRNNLLSQQLINLTEAQYIPEETITMINKHSFIQKWIKEKIINMYDIDGKTLDKIIISALSRRLFAIYHHKPKHCLHIQDTPALLRQELLALCSRYLLNSEDIITKIMTNLLTFLRIELTERTKDMTPEDAISFKYIFNNYLPDTKTFTIREIFENLISITGDYINTAQTNHWFNFTGASWFGLFNTAQRAQPSLLQIFYDNLLMLSEFLQPLTKSENRSTMQLS